jgi:hypothetical protein
MTKAILVVLLGFGLLLAGVAAISNAPPVEYSERR